MSQYSFLIDNMTWSFSRLNSFCTCPYEWYLQYIEGCKGENNFYAEFGTYCHKILEKYESGELSIFELSDYFDEHFNEEVPTEIFSKSGDLKEKYRELGISYFENIDLDLDSYEILGIEDRVKFDIHGHEFTGVIDLLVKDKKTGGIIVIDHKSADYPIGKRGSILKSKQKDFDQYKKQLYLYSMWVYIKYGVYPEKIGWNYFKSKKWLFLDFDKKEYDEAIQWVLSTIGEINSTEFFAPKQDFYYCHNLCRFRNSYCEYKNY